MTLKEFYDQAKVIAGKQQVSVLAEMRDTTFSGVIFEYSVYTPEVKWTSDYANPEDALKEFKGKYSPNMLGESKDIKIS